jgi:hypothetical protein
VLRCYDVVVYISGDCLCEHRAILCDDTCVKLCLSLMSVVQHGKNVLVTNFYERSVACYARVVSKIS